MDDCKPMKGQEARTLGDAVRRRRAETLNPGGTRFSHTVVETLCFVNKSESHALNANGLD